MYSNNPRNDLFKVSITPDFFVPEICDKFNNILKQMNYPLLSIEEMIMESVQDFISPAYSTQLGSQSIQTNDGGSTNVSPPPTGSLQNLDDQKTVSIVFRHTDGYLTYHCLLLHYFERQKTGVENPFRTPFDSIINTTFDPQGKISVHTKYYKCQMINFPELKFSYNSIDRQFDTFQIDFKYNIFSTDITLPTLKLD